jgi:hypothetical protein
MEVRIYMLRRISLIVASAAMVALSALPASAAMQSSTTHKLSFPGLHGVSAWGTYYRTSKFVRINVCAKDTARANFAVGAVALVYNSSYSRHTNIGAVAIGYNQTVCRSQTLLYTGHLRVYTFIGSNKGTISKRSFIRKVY